MYLCLLRSYSNLSMEIRRNPLEVKKLIEGSRGCTCMLSRFSV
jgi:hypothetical protein